MPMAPPITSRRRARPRGSCRPRLRRCEHKLPMVSLPPDRILPAGRPLADSSPPNCSLPNRSPSRSSRPKAQSARRLLARTRTCRIWATAAALCAAALGAGAGRDRRHTVPRRPWAWGRVWDQGLHLWAWGLGHRRPWAWDKGHPVWVKPLRVWDKGHQVWDKDHRRTGRQGRLAQDPPRPSACGRPTMGPLARGLLATGPPATGRPVTGRPARDRLARGRLARGSPWACRAGWRHFRRRSRVWGERRWRRRACLHR